MQPHAKIQLAEVIYNLLVNFDMTTTILNNVYEIKPPQSAHPSTFIKAFNIMCHSIGVSMDKSYSYHINLFLRAIIYGHFKKPQTIAL